VRYILSVIRTSLGYSLLLFSVGVVHLSSAQSYKYFRLGNPPDVQTNPVAGFAMVGGGRDLDEAFRWLCDKGNGGDCLVLRARGDDDYNSYVNGLCKANSVATLTTPDRRAAVREWCQER
jgi:cyanophycinase